MAEARLILGDALEAMRGLEPGGVDAVVTDPQYCAGAISEAQRTRAKGQGLRSDTIRRFGWFTGDNMGTAGLCWLLREVAREAKRLCRPTGSLLVFCDWRMLPAVEPAIESAGLRYQGLIVWDKGCFGLGTGFRNQHELILHFTFGTPEYHDKGTPNVIRCTRVRKDSREHQTQKPVELMGALIRVVCPPGGMVLDPFAGSATTGVACLRAGRDFIGIEIDSAYHAIAERRLALAAASLPGEES